MKGRNRRIAAAVGLAFVLALTALAAPAGAEAAKKGKKRGSNKAKVFRSNVPAAIPDRGLGADGSFGVLDSWIRVGKAMKGKEVADVDVGFSITGPPDQLADIGVYLQAPNGAFVMLARDNQGQPGNTSYGTGECRAGATRFSDETLNFISGAAPPPIQPGEIFSPWVATVQPQGFPLAIMDGGKARGRWTLHVEDDLAGATFTLNCWWVRIKPLKARR
jgi:subtilisin-like proprotein convertase family protein